MLSKGALRARSLGDCAPTCGKVEWAGGGAARQQGVVVSLATGGRALECGQTLRAPEELEVQRFRQQLRVSRAGSGSRVVERPTVQARHSHALAPVGGLRAFAACGRLSALAVSRCPRVPGAELALAENPAPRGRRHALSRRGEHRQPHRHLCPHETVPAEPGAPRSRSPTVG